MNRELLVIEVGADMTDDDISTITANADVAARQRNSPWMFMVRGFDSDDRELWEIPEVLALIDRLDGVGFASVLDAESTPEAFQRPLLDAFRFWLMLTRQMQTTMRLNRDLSVRFYDWLNGSNRRCDENTARLCAPQN